MSKDVLNFYILTFLNKYWAWWWMSGFYYLAKNQADQYVGNNFQKNNK